MISTNRQENQAVGVDRKQSELEMALNVLATRIQMLTERMTELSNRLTAVRVELPTQAGQGNNKTSTPAMSPVVEVITQYSANIQSVIDIVDYNLAGLQL
jgi:hypothetical protein